ncbi:hypothetical protein PO909_022705 [Leuciscus waleckii]
MSVEDVNSAGVVVDGKPNPCETQCQDGIVLVQMASLSMHMFTPADFKGKFRKIQPRKRPTIIKEVRDKEKEVDKTMASVGTQILRVNRAYVSDDGIGGRVDVNDER